MCRSTAWSRSAEGRSGSPAKVVFPAGRSVLLTIELTQGGRALLAHARLLPVSASGQLDIGGGPQITVARTFTLKR